MVWYELTLPPAYDTNDNNEVLTSKSVLGSTYPQVRHMYCARDTLLQEETHRRPTLPAQTQGSAFTEAPDSLTTPRSPTARLDKAQDVDNGPPIRNNKLKMGVVYTDSDSEVSGDESRKEGRRNHQQAKGKRANKRSQRPNPKAGASSQKGHHPVSAPKKKSKTSAPDGPQESNIRCHLPPPPPEDDPRDFAGEYDPRKWDHQGTPISKEDWADEGDILLAPDKGRGKPRKHLPTQGYKAVCLFHA